MRLPTRLSAMFWSDHDTMAIFLISWHAFVNYSRVPDIADALPEDKCHQQTLIVVVCYYNRWSLKISWLTLSRQKA